MKPVLKYPGSKFNIADWIVSHFPQHTHYVSAFFGSGADFFAKEPAQHEVINDLSGDVVNLFRVIRERGHELAALIELTPYAREEYELSSSKTGDALEDARRFLVRCCMAHGSDLSKTTATGWRTRGAKGIMGESTTARLWKQWPARIVAVIERLRDAEVENRPAVEVIMRHATMDTLIYCDPPYPLSTRSQKMYQHEMTDANHLELLHALIVHPGPVVLSGYACPLYDNTLYRWVRRTKKVKAEKGNTRTEVLWINPVCVERLGYGPLFAQETR